MNILLVIAIVVVVIGLIIAQKAKTPASVEMLDFEKRDPLFSPAERSFLGVLEQALDSRRYRVQYFAEHPVVNGKKNTLLIYPVRDRKLKRVRESGRLADNPDTKQHREIVAQYGQAIPVLMILRQEGAKEQGWGGYPFWWPVLFAPARTRPLVYAREV